MKRMVRCVAAACLLFGIVAAAQADFSLGAKLWYVRFGDEYFDDALMAGPKAEISSGDLWLSAMFLVGKTSFHEGWGEMDLQDAEIVVGRSFSVLDFGIGMRHTTWTVRFGYRKEDFKIFGPMVYVGAGSSFGDSPLGWYAGMSFMFLDLGDMEDQIGDSAEHYNIEVGVSYTVKQLQFTAGYRMKKFQNYHSSEVDLSQSGLTVSGVYSF